MKGDEQLSIFGLLPIDWRRVGVECYRAHVSVYVLDVWEYDAAWYWSVKHGSTVTAEGKARTIHQAKRRALGKAQYR